MDHLVRFAVGTYTVLGGEGIVTYSLQPRTLEVKRLGTIKVDNPSFLTISPNNRHIYAVGESGSQSEVHHIRVEDFATLLPAESVHSADDPCHIDRKSVV